MGRPRLTPEEREARRKERVRFSFSDAAYQHYDPKTEGYGSTDDWIAAAEALASGLGILHAKPRNNTVQADLEFLFINDLPDNIAGLKTAFRNSLFVYHPDHGGTGEQCREAIAAFERLSKHYRN